MEAGFDDAVVPLPDIFADQGGVGFQGVFIEVVENKDIDGVSGEGAFTSHGHQSAVMAFYLEFFAVTDDSWAVFPGGFDAGCGEYTFIERGVDQLLDTAVESAGEGLAVGGEDDFQGGIQPQQIGGQQPGGCGGFAVLRGHGDDQVFDGSVGEGVQHLIIGLVERFEREGGSDRSYEIGEGSTGQFTGGLCGARPF